MSNKAQETRFFLLMMLHLCTSRSSLRFEGEELLLLCQTFQTILSPNMWPFLYTAKFWHVGLHSVLNQTQPSTFHGHARLILRKGPHPWPCREPSQHLTTHGRGVEQNCRATTAVPQLCSTNSFIFCFTGLLDCCLCTGAFFPAGMWTSSNYNSVVTPPWEADVRWKVQTLCSHRHLEICLKWIVNIFVNK